MKTADAIWMCLPEGLDELFEMVRFERQTSHTAYGLMRRRNCWTRTIVTPTSSPWLYGICYDTGLSDAWQTGLSAYAQEQVVG